MNAEAMIRAAAEEMAEWLIEKNRAYGNSIFDPVRVFARDQTPGDQIDVRIDDKISRLLRGGEYPGDDTVRDLEGYLLLRRVWEMMEASR